jgi:hypothetical protein
MLFLNLSWLCNLFRLLCVFSILKFLDETNQQELFSLLGEMCED